MAGNVRKTVSSNSIADIMAKSNYIRPADFEAMDMPRLGITKGSFVVVDTETTGTGSSDEVVEMSVLSDDGTELYHSFFEPKVFVNPGASAVSGLTNDVLKGQPKFVDEWPNIASILNGKRIAGHNLVFDKRLMCQSLSNYGKTTEAEACGKLFDDMIDSQKIVAKCGVERGQRKLGELCAMIGVTEGPNHRSSHDCLGVLRVLQYCETHERFYDGIQKPVKQTAKPQAVADTPVAAPPADVKLQRIAYHDVSHGTPVASGLKSFYPVEFMHACDAGESMSNPYLVTRMVNGKPSHVSFLSPKLYQNLKSCGLRAEDGWGVIDAVVKDFYPMLTDEAVQNGLVRQPDKPFVLADHNAAVAAHVRPLPDLGTLKDSGGLSCPDFGCK